MIFLSPSADFQFAADTVRKKKDFLQQMTSLDHKDKKVSWVVENKFFSAGYSRLIHHSDMHKMSLFFCYISYIHG